jgi:hypothetical protein
VALQWRYSGGTVVVEWWYSGGTVVVHWWYSGGTLAVQWWWYSGGTVVVEWRYSSTHSSLLSCIGGSGQLRGLIRFTPAESSLDSYTVGSVGWLPGLVCTFCRRNKVLMFSGIEPSFLCYPPLIQASECTNYAVRL